jgi:hypothetical protein
MNTPRNWFLLTVILGAAASRLIPHPPNFAAIGALALFGGVELTDRRLAFLAPLAALVVGDLVLGFHGLVPWIYGSFGLIVCLGFWARRQRSVSLLGAASIAGSILFYIITNFGVWVALDSYPKTAAGLVQCYVAGLSSFVNTVLGDLFYAAILFGGLAVAERWCVRIRSHGMAPSTTGPV